MSRDAKAASRNLLASPYATKQTQFGDKKIWWFTVMFRGKVHYEIMGSDWKQTGAGVALLVARLERILQKNLGAGQRRIRAGGPDGPPRHFAGRGGLGHPNLSCKVRLAFAKT